MRRSRMTGADGADEASPASSTSRRQKLANSILRMRRSSAPEGPAPSPRGGSRVAAAAPETDAERATVRRAFIHSMRRPFMRRRDTPHDEDAGAPALGSTATGESPVPRRSRSASRLDRVPPKPERSLSVSQLEREATNPLEPSHAPSGKAGARGRRILSDGFALPAIGGAKPLDGATGAVPAQQPAAEPASLELDEPAAAAAALSCGGGPLSIEMHLPRGGRTNGVAGWGATHQRPIRINDPTPLRVETEQFEGHALFLLRAPKVWQPGYPPEYVAPAAVEFFKRPGNERSRFEIQVQGRFRAGAPAHPLSQLWLAIEIEEPLSLGFLTRGVCAAALRVLKAIAKGALHASWGSGPVGQQLPPGSGTQVELPHLAVPFTYVRCVVTPEGQAPPALGAEASAAIGKAIEASPPAGDGAQLPAAARAQPAGAGGTVTLAYNSSFFDPVLWMISGLGSLPPLSIHDILAELPVFITVYSLGPVSLGGS
ncbi:hypothetical protein T492DRAFT_846670 [Pavlovales sp. CCMP2436]|nr:hypothetical protein T492DRAFT_846670 [Pavlovales sp. CCMP2436]